MKTETEMLHDWIAEQREIYNNSHFETSEKKIEAIDRLLVLQEVRTQLIIFEKITSDAVIESWNTTKKDTTADYMLLSGEQLEKSKGL